MSSIPNPETPQSNWIQDDLLPSPNPHDTGPNVQRSDTHWHGPMLTTSSVHSSGTLQEGSNDQSGYSDQSPGSTREVSDVGSVNTSSSNVIWVDNYVPPHNDQGEVYEEQTSNLLGFDYAPLSPLDITQLSWTGANDALPIQTDFSSIAGSNLTDLNILFPAENSFEFPSDSSPWLPPPDGFSSQATVPSHTTIDHHGDPELLGLPYGQHAAADFSSNQYDGWCISSAQCNASSAGLYNTTGMQDNATYESFLQQDSGLVGVAQTQAPGAVSYNFISIQDTPPPKTPARHDREILEQRTRALAPLRPIETGSRGERLNASLSNVQSTTSSKKRQRHLTEQGRKHYKRMRASGACVRCRMLKDKCSQDEPCQRCLEIVDSAMVLWPRCYREKLENIMTFRNGNSRANQSRSEMPDLKWASENRTIRTLELVYPFLFRPQNNEANVLRIECRSFRPREGEDILIDVWPRSDGSKQVIEFPPWGCYDTESLEIGLKRYIEVSDINFDMDLESETTNEITKLTIQEAKRYAKKNPSSCVSHAVQLRKMAYFCRESMVLTGYERLGIDPLDDEGSPTHGQVPVPSVLDFQIDTTAIKVMRETQKKCVKALKSIMFNKQSKKQWYQIYLAVFVLLQTLGTVTMLQYSYNKWNEDMQDNTTKRVDYITRQMVDKWNQSAENLLMHFCFVVRGTTPLQFDWAADLKTIDNDVKTDMDSQAFQYMAKLTNELRRKPLR
ncbi:hypothetical protein F4808DRAFT_194952 [Astrocystis sublimbata]|nr:hypothetical protein F4808DRAFT_194952 [Astrocystis sublimbata]